MTLVHNDPVNRARHCHHHAGLERSAVQLTSLSSSSSIALRATSSTRLGEGRSPGAFIVLAIEDVSKLSIVYRV